MPRSTRRLGPNAWHRSGESYASHESRKGVVEVTPDLRRSGEATAPWLPAHGSGRRGPDVVRTCKSSGAVWPCAVPEEVVRHLHAWEVKGLRDASEAANRTSDRVAHRAEFSPHSWASVASSRVRCLVVRCATSPRSLTFASASVRPGASRPPSGSRRLVSRPSYPVPRHETREAREALRLR